MLRLLIIFILTTAISLSGCTFRKKENHAAIFLNDLPYCETAKKKAHNSQLQQSYKNNNNIKNSNNGIEKKTYGANKMYLNKFYFPVEKSKIVKVTKSTENKKIMKIYLNSKAKVFAVNDGKVIYAGTDQKKHGNMIIIAHANNIKSIYMCLADINIKKDQDIKKFDLIGSIDSNSILLFSMHSGSELVDAFKYFNLS